MTYLHTEAFEYNGSAVKHMLHTEVFLNVEDLGQRLYPRRSAPPDSHCDLAEQSMTVCLISVSCLTDKARHVYLHYYRDTRQLLCVSSAGNFLPLLAASWVGDGRQDSHWALAPYSNRSSAHAALPLEHALNKGVTPSIVVAFTWNI